MKPAAFGVASLHRLCTWNARFEVLSTGVADDSGLGGCNAVFTGKQLPLHLLQLKVQATTWNIRQQKGRITSVGTAPHPRTLECAIIRDLERVCSQTQHCQLRCLMTILDNYMFRPLLAIFRLSLRDLYM